MLRGEVCWLLPLLASLDGVPLGSVPKGTPSTMYRGWLDVVNELAPRTVMLTPAPGEPSLCFTSTPAILPCSPWATSTAPPLVSSSALICDTEPERSRFFMVP